LCTLKPKKPLKKLKNLKKPKNLKKNPKNLGFFQPWHVPPTKGLPQLEVNKTQLNSTPPEGGLRGKKLDDHFKPF